MKRLSATEAVRQMLEGGRDQTTTLPMQCNAEGWLRLTAGALSNVLSASDREFLERAMREYGRACVVEATQHE
jgi:hypothetical protein